MFRLYAVLLRIFNFNFPVVQDHRGSASLAHADALAGISDLAVPTRIPQVPQLMFSHHTFPCHVLDHAVYELVCFFACRPSGPAESWGHSIRG